MPTDLFASQGITPPTDLFAQQGIDMSNPSIVPRVAADMTAGLAEMGHGLLNAPHNITNMFSPSLAAKIPTQPDYNFGQMLGINKPNIGDNLLQGAAQYAPYALGGEAALAAKGVESAPSWLSRIGNWAGTGAVFGATQSKNPLIGAPIGALANIGGGAVAHTVGTGLGLAFGSKNIMNKIGNSILDYLGKSSSKAGALPPEEAAENLAKNYTNAQGQPTPVDIGTVANNPVLQSTYQSLKYSPFSGVADNMNQVKNQLSNKSLSDTQDKISAQIAQSSQEQQGISAAHDQLAQQANAGFQGQAQQQLSDPTMQSLNQRLGAIQQEQGKYEGAINNAPSYLNNLTQGVPDKSNITTHLKQGVSDVYQDNKAASRQDYAPINNSNLRLDQLSDNPFPNYSSAAKDLLANKENLTNLFGNDSDLGSALNKEVGNAKNVIDNNQNYGVTLPEAVTRIQNLGRLAASATGQGNRREGMLLGNLQDALSSDVHNLLNSSGNSDLSTKLLSANENFKNNVVPFWYNQTIRKSVTDKNYVPQQAKLATALHDPSPASQYVLSSLPQEHQNAALYQLMTGGKGTSSGQSTLGAQDIANNYGKLNVDTKRAIANYNPQADQYFEGLSGALKVNDQLNSAKSYIQNQAYKTQNNINTNLSNIESQRQKVLANIANQKQKALQQSSQNHAQVMESLSNEMKKLKQTRYGVNKEGGTAEKIGKAGLLGGAAAGGLLSPYTLAASIPLGFAARNFAKTLTNPELINAYINRTRLPTTQNNYLSPYVSTGVIGAGNALQGEKK
jgi:hypothetical protein